MPIVAAADCIRVEVVVEEKGDGTRGLDLRERRRRLLLERAAGPAFGLIDGTGAVVEVGVGIEVGVEAARSAGESGAGGSEVVSQSEAAAI